MFIETAIESILNQNCVYDFDVLISDDASPDNTFNIVNDLIRSHPKGEKIKYIRHSINLGMMNNSVWTLNNCTSKYIAFCEGDDFWIDNFKLQKQVSFLEKNSNFSMVFHDVKILLANQNDFFKYPKPKKDILFIHDIIKNHYIPTCSLVFRNTYFQNNLPFWFADCISGDIPFQILLASKGPAKYLDEKMGCYRRNMGGITQNKSHLSNIRSGYLFVYYNLLKEIGIYKGYYLIYKIFRIKASQFKNVFTK